MVKVSDETLRIRLAEFESTAASLFFVYLLLIGSLTLDEFNKLADQTNDFAVDERGEAVGDDGIMSSHPPAFVRNRLKDEQELQQLVESGRAKSEEIGLFCGSVLSLEHSLVENGTITPGSHLQRQKKVSRTNLVKQQDLESMYHELEEEMKAVLYGKSQTASQVERPSDHAVTTMNELDQTLMDPLAISSGVADSAISGGEGVIGVNEVATGNEGIVRVSEQDVQQLVAGAYDAEVEEMFLSEEEQKKKMELWEAANGDWLRQQEEKRKEKEAHGTKVTKRKKKVSVRC